MISWNSTVPTWTPPTWLWPRTRRAFPSWSGCSITRIPACGIGARSACIWWRSRRSRRRGASARCCHAAPRAVDAGARSRRAGCGLTGSTSAINTDNPDLLTNLFPPFDVHGNGIDDFYEIWQLPSGWSSGDNPADDLVPYDCNPSQGGVQTSPRNATLIVIADFAVPDGNDGPKSYIVRNFARVYLEGCTDKNGTFSRSCNFNGGGKFTIHARFVDQFGVTDSTLGLTAGYGDVEVFLRD